MEPRIIPLVDALNTTGLLETFSSCEGHFEKADQLTQDRNFADVRFYANDGLTDNTMEHFLTSIVTDFNDLHSFSPVTIYASKNYTPVLDKTKEGNPFFMIQLKPFDRFDHPSQKRKDVDAAILQLVEIVKNYKRL